MSEDKHLFELTEDEAGVRIDRVLAARLPEHSRSRLSGLIKGGEVLVDGQPVRPSEAFEAGARVELTVPQKMVDERVEPEAIPLAIIHEDDSVIVLDKPAGMVVHPGAGVRDGTLVSALLHHAPELAGVGGSGRSGLVHRLDRGTTGLLVVAKTERAHRELQGQFQARTIDKVYDAIVWGRPRESEGEIELPIARDPSNRTKMTTRAPGGRHAHSRYRVNEEVPGFAWVAVKILTGRTHQVRVHLLALGHPLVGDVTYAGDRARSVVDPQKRKAIRQMTRPALHARRLAFTHPESGQRMSFVSNWPEDLLTLWSALGGSGR